MATHKSAEKRHRQSLKRRDRNRSTKSDIRELVKSAKDAISKGNANAKELVAKAEKALAKAANKSVLHRKSASRRISRLAKLVAKKK